MFGSILEADFNLITEILVEKQRATKTNLIQMVTAVKKEEIRPVYYFLSSIKKWSDLLEGNIQFGRSCCLKVCCYFILLLNVAYLGTQMDTR